MLFAARQAQEQCREQNHDLYTVFVDLTKAFDSVSREGLWKLLLKAGCPLRVVTISHYYIIIVIIIIIINIVITIILLLFFVDNALPVNCPP